MTARQALYYDLSTKLTGPIPVTDSMRLVALGLGAAPPAAGLTMVGPLGQSGGNVLIEGATVDFGPASVATLEITPGVVEVQFGATLRAAVGGIIDLPALFKIATVATSVNVTAANLDTLTGGGATTLHSHASSTADPLQLTGLGLGVGPDVSTTRLLVKSSGTSSATYALKATDSAAAPLLHVRSDGRVGVKTTAPAATVDIVAGTQLDGVQALHVSGTLAASPVVLSAGIWVQITSAGSASPNPHGMYLTLEDGYTGGSTTYAFRGRSNVAATAINVGFEGSSAGAGLYGSNIGMLGYALSASGTTTVVGGAFTLENGPANVVGASAGLVANNATYAVPIFRGLDNGTLKWMVDDGGHTTWSDAVNAVFGTTTGTKIGTGTTQKIGFWNATPVVQQADVAAPTGGAVLDIEARAWCASVRTLLRTIGVMA